MKGKEGGTLGLRGRGNSIRKAPEMKVGESVSKGQVCLGKVECCWQLEFSVRGGRQSLKNRQGKVL